MTTFPSQGSAGDDLSRQAHQWWLEAAAKSGIELTGFDPDAPLAQRVAWALQAGLLIAAVYCRYSSKNQHSTHDQVRANVTYAGQHGMYVPPEFLCVDEAVKGRRVRRDGLDRLKAILRSRQATVLLVFKVSRLFRQAYLGYQLVQQEIVEEGLRAISTSQGIDTEDKKVWKAQLQLHGLLDDLLLDAIADHAREGLIGLFKQGFVTGALTVGFCAVEVPGAPKTNRGRTRTVPAVDPAAAELIRRHVAWHLEGMPLREGLRRWRAAGGPVDPRSTTGQMTYPAYRRLLSNPRLTGRWEFCRKRNSWSSKADYVRQIVQPDSEVHTYQCEDLRILSDEQFLALQQKLKSLETGPRGPRQPKEARLHDLVVDAFYCPHCDRRLHVCGAHGKAMRCPIPDCPAPAMLRRDEAVAAVCAKLTELLGQDRDLVDKIVANGQRLDAQGEGDAAEKAAELERKIRSRTNRIEDLTELAGEGSEKDRAEVKAKIRTARAERTGFQLELTRLQGASTARKPVTADAVRQVLSGFHALLEDAAAGRLGPEAVYKAADVFRRLVGGRVNVHVEERTGRKRGVVRGRFIPRLLAVAAEAAGVPPTSPDVAGPEIDVWLRGEPRLDAIAAEVRRLYEDDDLGFRAIAKVLGIGCGNVYQSYIRYYEMRGLPVPPRRPRGRRRSA
jgi:DNA invertase Pin-like site-specific DNA recombinase